MAATPVRVTLVGRAGCHLCDVAREVVERVCADLGVGWQELDVDADPAMLERWSEEVPVTLVDGRQHDFWRVDEGRLRAALAGPPAPPGPGAPHPGA
ncbi:glutaredoxin family protein [Phycicoccus sonneratiae]|uniref:Glutaredoxin family protein n=1 Tax=Phycicoccus sonneratiae TaxID=2807628 RepID=A0ABS2CJG7_9MICO|nr:glutaredoxin family protein [Phycicoccus sonneraticus]MBM6399930.1 glutaredoxin family protein [Phycicoccus sonneraticus]